MSTRSLRSQTRVSTDEITKPDSTPKLGKRNTSCTQDGTPSKKKKVKEADVTQSNVKGKYDTKSPVIAGGVSKKKTQGKKKNQTDEAEIEGYNCLDEDIGENDSSLNDIRINSRDDFINEEKTNMLPKETEMDISERGRVFEMESISSNEKQQSVQIPLENEPLSNLESHENDRCEKEDPKSKMESNIGMDSTLDINGISSYNNYFSKDISDKSDGTENLNNESDVENNCDEFSDEFNVVHQVDSVLEEIHYEETECKKIAAIKSEDLSMKDKFQNQFIVFAKQAQSDKNEFEHKETNGVKIENNYQEDRELILERQVEIEDMRINNEETVLKNNTLANDKSGKDLATTENLVVTKQNSAQSGVVEQYLSNEEDEGISKSKATPGSIIEGENKYKLSNETAECMKSKEAADIGGRDSSKEPVTNFCDQIDICEEKDNIKETDDGKVISPLSTSGKENDMAVSIKLPTVDDPIWKDRLPPPPGCESPPPLDQNTQEQSVKSFQNTVDLCLDTGKILNSVQTNTSGQLEIEFSINNLPKLTVNYIIKKGVRENEINMVSGAIVCTRGMFNQFLSTATPTGKPFHLNIKGPSRESLEIHEAVDVPPARTSFSSPVLIEILQPIKNEVFQNQFSVKEDTSKQRTRKGDHIKTTTIDNTLSNLQLHKFNEEALWCVQKLIAEGEEAQHILLDRVYVRPQQVVPSVDLIEKVLGADRANLQYISEQTGAEVTLRGMHSGYREVNGVESPHPLHLCLRHETSEGLKLAKEITLNLVKTINEELYPPSMADYVQPGFGVVPVGVFAPVPTPVPPPLFAPADSSSLSFIHLGSPLTANPVYNAAHYIDPTIPVPLSVPKVVYESAPQLKIPTNTSASSTTSRPTLKASFTSTPPPHYPLQVPPTLQTPTFRVPAPPMPKPVLKNSERFVAPPPLKKPPLSVPLQWPSSSERSTLSVKLPVKKTKVQKSLKNVPPPNKLWKSGEKPKQIKFSIITATKEKVKIVPQNPFNIKKPSLEEEAEAENSKPSNQANEAKKDSSSSEKERQKSSRWGQKTEEMSRSNKAKQLIKRLKEQIDTMKSGGNKARLLELIYLLENSLPENENLNDTERSKLKAIVDNLSKALSYLPSNQISKTMWEIVRILKTDYIEPGKSLNAKKTENKNEPSIDYIKSPKEADTRESARKRDRESHKTSSSSSFNRNQKLDSSKYYAHGSKSGREYNRTFSNKASESSNSKAPGEEKRQRDSSEHSSVRERGKLRDERLSESLKKEQKLKDSHTLSDKERKLHHGTYLNTKSLSDKQRDFVRSGSDQSNRELIKEAKIKKQNNSSEPMSVNSVNEITGAMSVKPINEIPKTTSDLITNQKTNSAVYALNQMSVSTKTIESSPKTSKAPLNSDLKTVVELLHKALKETLTSLDDINLKLMLSQIAQLLQQALPSGEEATEEQMSQFVTILDVLQQALQRNQSSLGQGTIHLISIISLLKSILKPNLTTDNASEKVGEKTSSCKKNSTNLTSVSSEVEKQPPSHDTRQLPEGQSTETSATKHYPETEMKNPSVKVKPDELVVVTKLLYQAVECQANSLDDVALKAKLTMIAQSLKQAASKSSEITTVEAAEKSQSNLLQVIALLEQLLTSMQSPFSQPPEILKVIQQLRSVLEKNINKANIRQPVDQTKAINTGKPNQNTSTMDQVTPTNTQQCQLLQAIALLHYNLISYCSSMEEGYMKSQLTPVNQMINSEAQEHMKKMPFDLLKNRISAIVTLLNQLLQTQPASNNESKKLSDLLQVIEKTINPPVLNTTNVLPSSQFGSFQQMPNFQTQQGDSLLNGGLTFQSAPSINSLVQLQFMHMMQQMQASFGTQPHPAASPVNPLSQLSQQFQALQQQLAQVSQFQTASISQQSLMQSLPSPAPQTTVTQPQANFSDLLRRLQQM